MIKPMRRESSTVVSVVGEVPDPLLAELARSPNVAVVRPRGPAEGDGDDVLEAAVLALRQATGRASSYVLVPADPLAAVAAQWRAMWDLSLGPQGSAGFEVRAAEAVAAWRAGRFELPDYYLVIAPAGAGRPSGSRADGGAQGGAAPGAGSETAAAKRGGAVGGWGGAAGGRGGAAEGRRSAAAGGRGAAARGPGAAARGSGAVAGRGAAEGSAGSEGAGPDLYLGPLRAVRPRRVAVVLSAPGERQGPPGAAPVLAALRGLRHGPWWPPLDELIDAARRFYPGALAEQRGPTR